AVAEYERTLIAERMRRGRLAKLRAGVLLPWTHAPYGYRVSPDRPRDPKGVTTEAAVVAELFAMYRRLFRAFGQLSPGGIVIGAKARAAIERRLARAGRAAPCEARSGPRPRPAARYAPCRPGQDPRSVVRRLRPTRRPGP